MAGRTRRWSLGLATIAVMLLACTPALAAPPDDPTSVDAVLGNPTVTLQRDVPGKGLQDVKRAPTAQDIAGLGGDYYLNLRGDPLGDTCR